MQFCLPHMPPPEEGMAVSASGPDLEPGCGRNGPVAIPAEISGGLKDDLVHAGAACVDEAALRDENQVWGRLVADSPASCREFVADLVDAIR